MELHSRIIDKLEEAISLLSTKIPSKKNNKEWSYGFVCGFIQGGLDVFWYNKFILEQSREFQKLLMVKALVIYIMNDKTDSDKIYDIYTLINNKDVKDDINIFKQKNKDQFLIKDFKTQLVDFLKNEISLELNQIFDRDKLSYCPDITNYIGILDFQNILPKDFFDSNFNRC
ncbi:MAG: hypothetical protein JXR64_02630 [Spirochaetales bacterium]|nr:hypothetical protein [Spirochaetales bacterium]